MMGNAMKMPTNPSSLTVREAPRILPNFPSSRGIRCGSAPAISKGGEVLNFNEFIVERPELVADSLDRRADIRSVSFLAAAGDEARVVHAVVNGAIGRILAGLGGEEMHDVELGHGQIHIDIVPIGATHPGTKHETAALDGFLRRHLRRALS